MKILARTALLAILAGGCSGTPNMPGMPDTPGHTASYIPGVYEGSGRGEWGIIRVGVRLDEGRILEIEILESGEDPFTGLPAMENLAGAVLEENSTGVDAVSGATASSRGFLAAVEEALEQARSGLPPGLDGGASGASP
ncbi:MAG: FMN-binding protein [Treponema sp.]|jgi:uncharacterized protein with FMN-binding domain|nr:FMN-binding protein [Treponema sp.]